MTESAYICELDEIDSTSLLLVEGKGANLGELARAQLPVPPSTVMISREYGIPCVANLAEACSLIPDGQMITVDGSSGRVSIDDEEQLPPSPSV